MNSLIEFAALNDDEDTFSDFEDAVLMKLAFPNKRVRRSLAYGKFCLEDIPPEECCSLFRFEKEDIKRLARALGLPVVIKAQGNRRCSIINVEALCMLLRRLTYPNRLADLERLFGMSSSFISMICNECMSLILENKRKLLEDLSALSFLSKQKLEVYAKAINIKGAPLKNCWGFIDGTAKAICRPSINQKDYYSGHKRMHCLKYQSIMCPDGIIASLHGPFLGKRHDAALFRESQIYSQMEKCTVFPDKNFCLFGDSAYPMRELLLRPYGATARSDVQEEFDTKMSSVRQVVEWGFGKIVMEFAFVDFRKNQKILLQDVGGMYATAALLANCHTCLYGSQVCTYFNLEAPDLEEYLS